MLEPRLEEKCPSEAEQDPTRQKRPAKAARRREREEDRSDEDEDRARSGEAERSRQEEERPETEQHDSQGEIAAIVQARFLFESAGWALSPSQR